MRKKWIAIPTLVAAVIMLAGQWFQSRAGTWTPLTATIDQRIFRVPGGELFKTDERIFASKADGSHVEAEHFVAPDGLPYWRRRVTDTSTDQRITVDESTESITTYYLPEGTASMNGRPRQSACSATAGAERDVMLGYDVVKVERELPGPEDQRRKRVTWMAPALDCLALKATSYMGPRDGTLVRTFEREVTSIIVGDPDPALFDIPQGYTERKPSEVAEEYNRRFPQEPTSGKMEKPDEAYLVSQQRKP